MILLSMALAAPEASGQLFRPSIDATRTLWTDDSQRAPSGYVLARGMLHYANRPVVFTDADGVQTAYLSDVLQLSALAAWSAGPVRVGLDVPVLLRTAGAEGAETGLGDLALESKLSLADGTRHPLGVALIARMSFPTTTVAAPLGNRGLGWEISAVVDRSFGPVFIGANLGTRGVPKVELDNFVWSNQFQARVGMGYALSGGSGLSLDVGTNINYANIVPGSTPAEAILGGWGRLSDSLVLRGGVGTGITAGYGAPRLRVISGLSWEPPRDPDADDDGIVDRFDACVNRAEDFDGYEDQDGCPEPTPVRVSLLNTAGEPVHGRWVLTGPVDTHGVGGAVVEVPAGVYVLEAFASGHTELSRAVQVPEGGDHGITMELQDAGSRLSVRITDAEGRDIPGAVWSVPGDGPSEVLDSVLMKPGTLTVQASADGYRPSTQILRLGAGESGQVVFSLATVDSGAEEQIWVNDSIYFETARSTVLAESHDLLDEVASVFIDHPEMTRIRIEGHTDSRGSASYNQKLSAARAAAVLEYLVEQGVERSRLDSVGFGESRPLVEGQGEAAWSKNRRVDFFVVERGE